MSECLSIGQVVPNFEMEVYDPNKSDFGKITLDEIRAKRSWTVLFFYPADFTFVCPTELDDLADKQKQLKDLRCEVIASEVNFYNVGRNADELLRKMQANIYLSGHPDEVCPANWHEGEKTIKPSAKIVGKIYEAMK